MSKKKSINKTFSHLSINPNENQCPWLKSFIQIHPRCYFHWLVGQLVCVSEYCCRCLLCLREMCRLFGLPIRCYHQYHPWYWKCRTFRCQRVPYYSIPVIAHGRFWHVFCLRGLAHNASPHTSTSVLDDLNRDNVYWWLVSDSQYEKVISNPACALKQGTISYLSHLWTEM